VRNLTKMQPNECRCTKKGMQLCYVPDVGVRIKGKCPSPIETPKEETKPAPTSEEGSV